MERVGDDLRRTSNVFSRAGTAFSRATAGISEGILRGRRAVFDREGFIRGGRGGARSSGSGARTVTPDRVIYPGTPEYEEFARASATGTERGFRRAWDRFRGRGGGDVGTDPTGRSRGGGFGVNVPLYGGGVLLSSLGGGPLSGAAGGILQAAGSFSNPYLAAYALAQVGQSLRQIGEESSRLQGIDLAYRNITTNALGGVGAGDILLEQLEGRFGGISTTSQLKEFTNRLLAIDAATSIQETVDLAEIGLGLGKAFGRTPEESIQSFSLLLSNESIRRLDSFGISAIQVRERIRELQEETPDLTRSEAFYISTTEAAQTSLRKIGGVRGIITPQQLLSTQISQGAEDIKKDIGRNFFSPLALEITKLIDPSEAAAIDFAQKVAADPKLSREIEAAKGLVSRDFTKILGPRFSPLSDTSTGNLRNAIEELQLIGNQTALQAALTFPLPRSLSGDDFVDEEFDLGLILGTVSVDGGYTTSLKYNNLIAKAYNERDEEKSAGFFAQALDAFRNTNIEVQQYRFTEAEINALNEDGDINFASEAFTGLRNRLFQFHQLSQDSQRAFTEVEALSFFDGSNPLLSLAPGIGEDIRNVQAGDGFFEDILNRGYVNDAILGEFISLQQSNAAISEGFKIIQQGLSADPSLGGPHSILGISSALSYTEARGEQLERQQNILFGEGGNKRPNEIPLFDLLLQNESSRLNLLAQGEGENAPTGESMLV